MRGKSERRRERERGISEELEGTRKQRGRGGKGMKGEGLVGR